MVRWLLSISASFRVRKSSLFFRPQIICEAAFGRSIPWPDADIVIPDNHKVTFLESLEGMFRRTYIYAALPMVRLSVS